MSSQTAASATRRLLGLNRTTLFPSAATGRPPSLSRAAVTRLVTEVFPFQHVDQNSVKQLPSYDDRNFYFRGTPECAFLKGASTYLEREYVLKLNNPLLASYGVLKGINALLTHLHNKGFTECIQPMNSRDGENVVQIAGDQLREDGACDHDPESITETVDERASTAFMRVVSYIPGECLDHVDKHYLTPNLLYSVGYSVGRAQAIIQDGFHNHSLERRTLAQWDLSQLTTFEKHLHILGVGQKREIAKSVLDDFEKHIHPRMSSFKKGIIYGDANGLNIIIRKDNVGDYQMAGMIDFGDCIPSYYIFDLGILLAYVMMENLQPTNGLSPVEFVGPVLRGYTDAFPLSREELECLYYIVMARCCQSALNGAYSFKQEPWNTYLLTSPAKSWKLIKLMLNTSKESVDRMWASALV